MSKFEDPNLPVGHLSPSSIGTYLQCPKQFQFRYEDKLKFPPPVPFVEGDVVHQTLAFNNYNKRDKGRDLKLEMVLQFFSDKWSEAAKTIERDRWRQSRDNENKIHDRAVKWFTQYLLDSRFAQAIQPLEVERKFKARIGGIPIVGIVDLEEEDMITDYKTSAWSYKPETLATSLQVSIYKIVRKKQRVSFIVLVKQSQKVEQHKYTPKKKDLAWDVRVIQSVADAVKRGAYPVCPREQNAWFCNAKFCDYWHLCRGSIR